MTMTMAERLHDEITADYNDATYAATAESDTRQIEFTGARTDRDT